MLRAALILKQGAGLRANICGPGRVRPTGLDRAHIHIEPGKGRAGAEPGGGRG